MKQLSFRAALVPATLLLVLSACSGSDTDSAPADEGSTPPAETPVESDAPADDAEAPSDDVAAAGTGVNIKDSRYDPGEIDVAVGDTVTFTNSDSFAHTVTSKKDQAFEFASGEFADGATFDLTFEEAGTFAYFCEIHPTMRATVNVS